MSCIHYKFRNNSNYDTITFDGSFITVGEIKQAILGQKKMGRAPDFSLQIINAQTQQEYSDDNTMIPRNADVTVKRIPTGQKVSKAQLAQQSTSLDCYKMSHTMMPLSVATETDLSKTEGTEEDKLKAMMKQQSMAYDAPKTNKRFSRMDEEVPMHYICHRCGRPGHLIKNCPTNGDPAFEHRNPHPFRKMNLTLKNVDKKPEKTPEEKRQEEQTQQDTRDKVKSLARQIITNLPIEMKCPICEVLMIDACLSTCCGQSFCDECIREKLLEETRCPSCWAEVYPDTLAPNKSLRITINKYKKEHDNQIAKLYSDCNYMKSRSGSIEPPKPEPEIVEMAKTHIPIRSTTHTTKPLVEATSNLALNAPPVKHERVPTPPMVAIPPVAIIAPSIPPPAVAILPLKEEIGKEPVVAKVMEDKKPLVSTILPQIATFPPPITSTLLPLPPMHVPFNPLLAGPLLAGTAILPAPGLLPPPLPLPEPQSERILDQTEFYAIQKELRRLQRKRRSSSPQRRRHTPNSSHDVSRDASPDRPARVNRLRDDHHTSSRHQGSYDRFRAERERDGAHRNPRFPIRGRRNFYDHGRGGTVRTRTIAKRVREDIRNSDNDRRDSDKRSNDSDRRSRESDVRSRDSRDRRSRESEHDRRSRDSGIRSRESNHVRESSLPKTPPPTTEKSAKHKKHKDHKKKKHKKDKKEKRNKKAAKEAGVKPLTGYSASEHSTLEERDEAHSTVQQRTPSPVNPIRAPKKASPSPERPLSRKQPLTIPKRQYSLPERLDTPARTATPKRERSATPKRERSATPELKRSATPECTRPTTTEPQRSPTPECKRPTTPEPQRSPTPERKRTVTPEPQRSPTPELERTITATPELERAVTPERPPTSLEQPMSPHRLITPDLPPISTQPLSSVPSEHSLPTTPLESPAHTPVGTPTAGGGVTPQFDDNMDEDEVSLKIDLSDRDVNGVSGSSSDDSSAPSSSANLEELRMLCKKKEYEIQQLRLRAAVNAKKKHKKKKKKNSLKEKEDKYEERKLKKQKKKLKEEVELEEGEIKEKQKKRKRSHSEMLGQDKDVKKKSKKSKHSKHHKKDKIVNGKPPKGVEIKVNLTPIKNMNYHSLPKTISIISPPKKHESRRVHLNVSTAKPLKVESKLFIDPNTEKIKKSKGRKKSKHKITKNAVSGIEDDID